ncbi:MAG: 5-formyltetrahydrofolate cyclo-ligase [Rhodanobacter sp. SCN 68-63]|nr:MAG: 5-formyltetrahydrofolate cyclo-ligase [Rhodanobacter sp. SCN 68-63]
MDAIAQRRELRQRLTERRKALTPQQRIAAAQGNGELALNLVIPPLLARGQQFLLPLLGAERQLRFAPWSAGEPVEPNRHGIPEPVQVRAPLAPFQLDLVLVPLLAFDRRGQRLGYGGGYYDRSFAFLNEQARPTEPLLVGIAYDFQEVDSIEPARWDVPLDFVATDRELIDCHAERPRETHA